MIDIKDLKNNTKKYLQSFSDKGFFLNQEVNEIIQTYDHYKSLLLQEQTIREELNKTTSNIKNNKNNKEHLTKAKLLSTEAGKIKKEIANLKDKITDTLALFPNPASDMVPTGKDEKDNLVISTHLDELKNNVYSKPHWEIMEEKNLLLTEESSIISGARHVVYNGKAALVVKALERFMIDNAISNNFNLVEPPVIVNKTSLFNTGQLPKFENDLFKVGDQYLIPTAEVPLTNIVANKLLKIDNLPLRYVAGTNCFRKEAGSAGKDTRGLIRLHQFRKVELVTIGIPSREKEDFELMLNTATSILEKLELPYRLIQLCTGDLSFTARETIDIEVWMPGVNTYREISSVSSIGNFQARRMKARYKDTQNKKYFLYTHNGSSLAIGRTLAAIIENNIQENGLIKVPEALRPYLPFFEF